ncbi:MAG: transglycosylase SLT domain-containing protein [Methylophilus sp.]|nr:transglycosylase SLT domain-containing protein [Methylophilus sp.]
MSHSRYVYFVSFLMALLVCAPSAAFTQSQLETFDNEPPVNRDLLMQASLLLDQDGDADAAWKAANLYCQATRFGSAEGAYRLGMLYAVGQGVPASREFAANLFRIASNQGHVEAQKMLETIEISSNENPPCVQQDILPEKSPVKLHAPVSPAIDTYIASLPKSKRWLVDLVEKVANWHQVDSKLVLSIITAESNFKTSALSNKEAQGLMQIIPATAERFNVKNAFNASQNIKGGVKYLRWLLSYFRGDVTLAVAAYNSGEGAVDRYRGVPPYKETRAYVKKVMALYGQDTHKFDANMTSPSPTLKAMKAKKARI